MRLFTDIYSRSLNRFIPRRLGISSLRLSRRKGGIILDHIMTRSIVLLLLVGLVALSFAPTVAAFGAGMHHGSQVEIRLLTVTGNIPSYSHLEDRAFRHGDIEDIIEKCKRLDLERTVPPPPTSR